MSRTAWDVTVNGVSRSNRVARGIAIAVIGVLSAANSMQNEPAPAMVDAPRSKVAGAQGSGSPTSTPMLMPGAVNPLSERSRRIKQGLETPSAPGASPAGATPGALRVCPGKTSSTLSPIRPGAGDRVFADESWTPLA